MRRLGIRRLSTSSVLTDPSHQIKRIVLTGGPCGGKSTSLSYISEFLRGRGFAVYQVPEAATLMMTAGVSFAGVTRDQLIDTQAELCRVQLALEDSFFNIARSRAVPAVILSDRGAMDGKAYLPPDCWADLLKRNQWNEWDLREARYDGVVHLVTTAMGQEQFYSSENNKMRSETIEQARRIDETLQHAWLGHPHVAIIDNSATFQGKLQRVTEFVCQQVGIPVPSANVKRFMLREPLQQLPVPHYEFNLMKIYLRREASAAESVQLRLESRCSTISGSRPVFRLTEKTYATEPGAEQRNVIIKMRRIAKSEYLSLLPLADPERHTVHQIVRNFVFKGQYFSAVQTVAPQELAQLSYVEVTTSKGKAQIELPDWINVVKDVTDDPACTSFQMSLRKSEMMT